MNSAHFGHEQPSSHGRFECVSAIDLLLRLAFGGVVTKNEALRALHDQPEPDDRRRIERAARIKARNLALFCAARELGGDEPGVWIVANRLADAIERFEIRQWPRLVAGHECNLSPSELAIYQAFLSGESVPKTGRHLYSLLK